MYMCYGLCTVEVVYSGAFIIELCTSAPRMTYVIDFHCMVLRIMQWQ